MSRKPSFKFPSISYDLLSQLIQSFSSEDLSNCSVKRNDSQLILKIDLHPDRSEEIVERFTFNSYKQGSITFFHISINFFIFSFLKSSQKTLNPL